MNHDFSLLNWKESEYKVEDSDLEEVAEKAWQMLRDIGIPVAEKEVISVCYEKYLNGGLCIGSKKEKKFNILVGYKYKRDPKHTLTDTMTLMLHELVHTCDECHDNHKELYQKYAGMVKEAYGNDLLIGVPASELV